MMDIPLVTFQALSDQPNMVFVHQGEKVRRFSASDDDQIRNTLRNVFIAEFGIPQEEAIQAAADVVEQLQAKVAQEAAVLAEMEDTRRELTAETERRIKAESDLSLAQGDIANLTKRFEALTYERDDLMGQIKNALAKEDARTQNSELSDSSASPAVGAKEVDQSASQQTDTTPEPGGGVSTPAGETPPAETDPPQTKSGAAPIEAVTGGTEGKTDG